MRPCSSSALALRLWIHELCGSNLHLHRLMPLAFATVLVLQEGQRKAGTSERGSASGDDPHGDHSRMVESGTVRLLHRELATLRVRADDLHTAPLRCCPGPGARCTWACFLRRLPPHIPTATRSLRSQDGTGALKRERDGARPCLFALCPSPLIELTSQPKTPSILSTILPSTQTPFFRRRLCPPLPLRPLLSPSCLLRA